jgi:hypothetical protein
MVLNQCFDFFSADRSPFQRRTTTTTPGAGNRAAESPQMLCAIIEWGHHRQMDLIWTKVPFVLGPGSGVEVFSKLLQSPNTVCHVFNLFVVEQVSQFFRETVLIE